jgi:DENN (AEX-3) domain
MSLVLRNRHRTMESLQALQGSVIKQQCPHANLSEYFLHICAHQHAQMASHYLTLPEEERKPMMLTCEGLEFGSPKLKGIDTTKFLFPTSLLQPPNVVSPMSNLIASPILPLLRCLGVPNTLRLLSGLMSERRVLLVSQSPTRLATCARSALSMLAQGLLSWQHLYIPVLPPHLLQYLQAPMPYLIGVLANLLPTVNALQELGEVLVIHLDHNALETRGIPQHLITTRIPDLFRSAMRDETIVCKSILLILCLY